MPRRSTRPISGTSISPMGEYGATDDTPKRDSTDRRVILDLSYPPSKGMNSGITKNCMDGQSCSYTLPSINDLVTHVQILGQGAWLWKADLERAYRQFRIDPQDLPLLGIYFEGSYYLDLCPSFGARLSSSACQRFTSAVVYLVKKASHWALAYLDDFCGAQSDYHKAMEAYEALHTIAARLGLQLAREKCAPPAQRMKWLGFMIDTTLMTHTISEDKLTEVLLECRSWLKTNQQPKREFSPRQASSYTCQNV